MKFVVKIGGAALEDEALLRGCARAIATLAKDGNQVAVVHGGGAQLTRTLKQMGKKKRVHRRLARHRRRDPRYCAHGSSRTSQQGTGCGDWQLWPDGSRPLRRRRADFPGAQETHLA